MKEIEVNMSKINRVVIFFLMVIFLTGCSGILGRAEINRNEVICAMQTADNLCNIATELPESLFNNGFISLSTKKQLETYQATFCGLYKDLVGMYNKYNSGITVDPDEFKKIQSNIKNKTDEFNDIVKKD